jgi:RNA polymerase sigma-70 factor (ECF subfamily)
MTDTFHPLQEMPAHGIKDECAPDLSQDALYEHLATQFSPALGRIAAAYEADAQRRQDLLQDIHFKLWRSLESFNRSCSLGTWVYRVAHNTAATYVLREKRQRKALLCDLEDIELLPDATDDARKADGQRVIERLHIMIRKLKPLDRQIVLLQLEGLKPAEIANVTGITSGNVATKLHRFTQLLKAHFGAED